MDKLTTNLSDAHIILFMPRKRLKIPLKYGAKINCLQIKIF